PRPAVSSRRCRPLDSATRKVIGSAPPTGTASSPEWKYQSKTAEGLSSGSATNPSRDMDIRAMTLDISTPVRTSREQAGRDEGSPLGHASLRGARAYFGNWNEAGSWLGQGVVAGAGHTLRSHGSRAR